MRGRLLLPAGGAAIALAGRRAGRRSRETTREVEGRNPGDEVVDRATWRSTRPITIRRRPEQVVSAPAMLRGIKARCERE